MQESRSSILGSSASRTSQHLGWPVRYWIIFASSVFAIVVAWELLDLFIARGQPFSYPATELGWGFLIAGLLGEALLLMAIAMLILEACLLMTRARRSRSKAA